MKILIFNKDLLYLENEFQHTSIFLLINSKILETNKLIIFSPYLEKLKQFNFKKLFRCCNMSLIVLYEVVKEYYKINVLDKPFFSNEIAIKDKPFFYKKQNEL
jgi:hypothetical protein